MQQSINTLIHQFVAILNENNQNYHEMKAIQKVPPKFDKLTPSLKSYKKENKPKPTMVCMKFDTTFPMVTAEDFFEKFTDTAEALQDRDTYAEGEILEEMGTM